MIAYKEGKGRMLIDLQAFGMLQEIKQVNCDATNVLELYRNSVENSLPTSRKVRGGWNRVPFRPGSIWDVYVMDPTRAERQHELRTVFMQFQVVKLQQLFVGFFSGLLAFLVACEAFNPEDAICTVGNFKSMQAKGAQLCCWGLLFWCRHACGHNLSNTKV